MSPLVLIDSLAFDARNISIIRLIPNMIAVIPSKNVNKNIKNEINKLVA